MVLIFIVLASILMFWMFHESNVNKKKTGGTIRKNGLKTNATLERAVLHEYMCEGYSFSEAYSKTVYRMSELGFSACIPKEAYTKWLLDAKTYDGSQSFIEGTSYVYDVEQYDSYVVKQKREQLRKLGIPLTESNIYGKFPKTQSGRDLLYQTGSAISKSEIIGKIGDFVVHADYGVCEIVNLTIGNGSGCYTLKSVDTGKTFFCPVDTDILKPFK